MSGGESSRARAEARLRRYHRAVWKAEALSEEVQELRQLDRRIGPTLTGTPRTGRSGSRVAGTVERLESRTRQLEQQVDCCLRLQQELGELLDRLGDERLSRLLWLRYIRGYGWKEISVELGLTERWVRTLHRRALEMLGGLEELPQAAEGAERSPTHFSPPPRKDESASRI